MAVFLRALHVPLSWREIFRRTLYEAFWKDNCLAMAAQLAYYFFFALFPTLLFLVALASYFPVTTLIDDMFRTLGGLLPPEASDADHRSDRQDLQQQGCRADEPRRVARRVELVGRDDGDHRHAQPCLRHRGAASVVEGAADGHRA